MRSSVLLVVLLCGPGLVPEGAAQVASTAADQRAHPVVATAYVPQRVFDTRRRAFSDFEVLAADLARADIVVVGEQHGDPNTHRLQAALLQGLLRRRVPVVLSLEMFERDVQPALDGYLAGTKSEDAFLTDARPWPRYASDYRPLVEMARAHGWPVVAANVPRRIAGIVAKEGPAALDALAPEERGFVARELRCPEDDYFRRFVDAMHAHPVAGAEKLSADDQREVDLRFFWSQCVKDETMAEAVVEAWERASHDGATTLVHYTGAFHSDFGAGVVERVRRRLPQRRTAVVSILPVDDLDRLAPTDDDLRRADYLLYTTAR